MPRKSRYVKGMQDYEVWGKSRGTKYKYGSPIATITTMMSRQALAKARNQSHSKNSMIYGFTVTRVKRA